MSDYGAKLEHRQYVGISGGGKTSLMLEHVQQPAACRFIFDPTGQMSHRLKRRSVSNARDLALSLPSGWCLFNPHVMFPGQQEQAFNWFCSFAFNASRTGKGRKFFVADEIWQYCSAHKIPRELATIVQMGRVEGLVLLAATQTPHKVPDPIWGQTTDCYAFQITGKLSLEYVEKMGCDPAWLQKLPAFRYLHFDPRNPVVFTPGQSRKI